MPSVKEAIRQLVEQRNRSAWDFAVGMGRLAHEHGRNVVQSAGVERTRVTRMMALVDFIDGLQPKQRDRWLKTEPKAWKLTELKRLIDDGRLQEAYDLAASGKTQSPIRAEVRRLVPPGHRSRTRRR